MICRRSYINNVTKEHTIVWFGSYGLNIVAPYQEIQLVNNETEITNTCKRQEYNLIFNNINNTTIKLYDTNNNVIDSYTTSRIGQHNLIGTLDKELSKIEINVEDYDNITLILNEYGTAKLYDNVQHNNFSKEQQAVSDSLNQSLSVIKNELWYNYNFGVPLESQNKTKLNIDIFIINTINENTDVKNIIEFNSMVEKGHYSCNMIVDTVFGKVALTI